MYLEDSNSRKHGLRPLRHGTGSTISSTRTSRTVAEHAEVLQTGEAPGNKVTRRNRRSGTTAAGGNRMGLGSNAGHNMGGAHFAV
jgi:hypothetical protein